MDRLELQDMSSVCEDENCGLTSSFPEDCPNQDCDWEEPMFGLTELVCVTVIYIPVMLFGLLGNVLTILVVWLRPRMRSSTYLYLSSMAVSDLMILLLLPLDLYKLWRPRPWPFGELACKMTMFLSECCTFCTILHITFLSLERYVAVRWPITAKTLITRRRTRAVIGCLWLGAALSAAPVLVMVGVEEVGEEDLRVSGWRENGRWMGEDGSHMTSLDGELDAQTGEEKERHREGAGQWNWLEDGEMGGIGEKMKQRAVAIKNEQHVEEDDGEQENLLKRDEGEGWESNVGEKHKREIDRRECRCTDYAISSGLLSAMMILSNLYFLVPVCILVLVYGLIGRILWLRPQSSRREQSHRHTVKMLGVIVLAFVLCWLPFHVGRTIFFFSLGTGTDILYYLSQYFNLGSSVLFYLSAAINPLLYNVMSARYRHAV
ncbi:growth hormone secretagogue receptor type 1-like [Dunckerocampus dactyliophorus]|uniref:growth hormone secretagogue receptor type 1-like n=1 Tax=Dunckerocampus dactyliophorus TaxID=161453 RepID=UPI0024056754|nr:growth hormone secretagogue receptor type 1-like [Dunckerocampus dactyliophorus]